VKLFLALIVQDVFCARTVAGCAQNLIADSDLNAYSSDPGMQKKSLTRGSVWHINLLSL
jgi:hypothetical protein